MRGCVKEGVFESCIAVRKLCLVAVLSHGCSSDMRRETADKAFQTGDGGQL